MKGEGVRPTCFITWSAGVLNAGREQRLQLGTICAVTFKVGDIAAIGSDDTEDTGGLQKLPSQICCAYERGAFPDGRSS